ncbi:hypothetical protein B0T26DRAFT_754729 [Lasiosphaeria miniovina]|uniref:Uncharacterized protein n=1 Tax=Lasiosphaeria miniovina TaxID=1954250 RepID=A0AA40A568_9PEZI|nr:uncharacterized protein B0T26DRAFT_754729 [Lasiosphaeria miniovina]KAK0709541.1 hypothetical protein B0T26DRAFT_754729 [Lasiosphaeria miniovina]
MAESSKDRADGNRSDNGNANGPRPAGNVNAVDVRGLLQIAAERQRNSPRHPVAHTGVPANVAMRALLDAEEESWREDLRDPNTTEEERVMIEETLSDIQSHRRWLDFTQSIVEPHK